ncbi:uncharacterized protein LOC143516498 [Brachyhypopomus gauderio]|uniref:uncharacterized protein LOC143516498 n=1 Tax=Brachyhypopomus gauderio TaxID=698409 RepID=UPI004040F107
MPPKKVQLTQSEQQEEHVDDEERQRLPTSSQAVATKTDTSIEQLCNTLQDFVRVQQEKDEHLQREAARQEQRWRSLHHQFGLLQDELRRNLPERRREESETTEAPGPSRTQILRSRDETPRAGQYQHEAPRVTHTPPTPRMPTLKETDDIEHFLTMFERIAQATCWPRETWALYLVPLLEGKARAAYVAMDADDAGEYDKVKQAILKKYEINKETYRQRFRNSAVKEDETPREFFTRLKGLYEKWMVPKEKSKEEIGDTIILEQFLRTVKPELRSWIIERSPTSADQVMEMAEAFQAARQTEAEFRHGNVHRMHHAEPGKYGGGSSGGSRIQHTRITPQSHWRPNKNIGRVIVNSDKRQEEAVWRCYNCNQIGHKANVCPKRESNFNRLCYIPQRATSTERQESCTDSVVYVKIGGKRFKALIDTGASQSMILAECLPELRLGHTGSIRVKCIHGDEQVYPTADVSIEIKGQAYMLKVGIIQSAPYAVILGRDLPILVDLLTGQQSVAEGMIATRLQTKRETAQESKVLLKEMPFNMELRKRKSKREKRQDKTKGTVLVEKLENPNIQTEILPSNIAQLQSQDESLKPLFSKYAKDIAANKNDNCLVLKENILYRVKGDQEQLVVPKCLRQEVIKLAHSEPWAGHLGHAKTLDRIAHRFYWPSQHVDVAEFCKTCPECQLTAPAKKSDRVPLINLPIVETPFTRIAMDIVGPLPRSQAGNRYILVICDYATRYPEAFPLRKVKTRQLVNALMQLISRVGIPREILTDQGTNLTSKQFREVFKLLGIKGIRTTPYHPQTDGLVERFNKTLKSMLKKFVADSGTDWDTWLPYLLFAYREVPQASTGFSPFELLYGREVRGPLDVLKEAWEGHNTDQKLNSLSYVLKMREKMATLTEMVHKNMEKAQKHQKMGYDRTAKNRGLVPGEKAIILLPTSDTSLLAKWQGPYEVIQRIGQTSYELLLPDKKKKKQVFHINMLRAWRESKMDISEQMWIRAIEEEEETREQYFPIRREDVTQPMPLDLSHLGTEQRRQLERIIPTDLFKEEPGKTNIMHHNIRLLKNDPIRQTNCRVPARLMPDLKREVETMLELGVIEPSRSEWCSPVVLVPKKDGGLRFCVDFSKLNAVSAFDPYPMPRADELIERLGRAKYLTTLDLSKGYWQVPLTPAARELTAFRTPSGLYHFTVMPFGLHGAAATFQRLMNEVLKGTEEFAAAYIDDVVIYSTTWAEHVQQVGAVLQRIADAGLTVNPSKCYLAKGEVSYLGYVLGGGVIRPQVSKIEAVKECPVPTTKKRVRSFLGLVGWYRRFIPNFSSRAAVLTDLVCKDKPQRVKWTEECEVAFQDLKACLCSEPILRSPDFSKAFLVQTDASGKGLGAVLLQGEEGDMQPILYISRKLFPRETNYSTVEKEALAVKWALDSLKYYLMGAEFTLETDHRALQWMQKMKDSNARITRWYLSLQPFRFCVKYRKGEQNVAADFLSRHP